MVGPCLLEQPRGPGPRRLRLSGGRGSGKTEARNHWPKGKERREGMKIDQFLKHHGIAGNPFSEEDAQTDTVFKRGCLQTIHHPAWDKFFGSPADPSTALVFGEKGSGKTALRLQVTSELDDYNKAHPEARAFVISYDDFNPFLHPFRGAVRGKDAG